MAQRHGMANFTEPRVCRALVKHPPVSSLIYLFKPGFPRTTVADVFCAAGPPEVAQESNPCSARGFGLVLRSLDGLPALTSFV